MSMVSITTTKEIQYNDFIDEVRSEIQRIRKYKDISENYDKNNIILRPTDFKNEVDAKIIFFKENTDKKCEIIVYIKMSDIYYFDFSFFKKIKTKEEGYDIFYCDFNKCTTIKEYKLISNKIFNTVKQLYKQILFNSKVYINVPGFDETLFDINLNIYLLMFNDFDIVYYDHKLYLWFEIKDKKRLVIDNKKEIEEKINKIKI